MSTKKSYQNRNNDNILRHFILIGIFLFDGIKQLIEFLITASNNNNDLSNKTKENIHSAINISRTNTKNILLNRDRKELQGLLKEIDILSDYNKDELTELILIHPKALSKLIIQDRRAYLNKMTVAELRPLLKGVNNLSKLKKHEIIELILFNNNIWSEQELFIKSNDEEINIIEKYLRILTSKSISAKGESPKQ